VAPVARESDSTGFPTPTAPLVGRNRLHRNSEIKRTPPDF
jgi:hypothetical protein